MNLTGLQTLDNLSKELGCTWCHFKWNTSELRTLRNLWHITWNLCSITDHMFFFTWYIAMVHHMAIWRFLKMGVPPNHPFSIGFSMVNHPALGVPPWLRKHGPHPFLTIGGHPHHSQSASDRCPAHPSPRRHGRLRRRSLHSEASWRDLGP